MYTFVQKYSMMHHQMPSLFPRNKLIGISSSKKIIISHYISQHLSWLDRWLFHAIIMVSLSGWWPSWDIMKQLVYILLTTVASVTCSRAVTLTPLTYDPKCYRPANETGPCSNLTLTTCLNSKLTFAQVSYKYIFFVLSLFGEFSIFCNCSQLIQYSLGW